MAIVWACPLSVEEYKEAGREVSTPKPDCPRCGRPMARWSGYERSVRVGGACHRVWVRRCRCRSCRVSQALVPAFCLLRRLDMSESVGQALTQVVGARCGCRRVAEGLGVPHTTARDWVRRFAKRAEALAAGFAALAVEVGGHALRLPQAAAEAALGAISGAWAAARSRAGKAVGDRWAFASLVTGGALIGTNRDPPWSALGGRRWIPPVP